MNKGMRRWVLVGVASLALVSLSAFAGVKEDQAACDKGDAEACLYLGVSYSKGEGVQQDKQKATQLFQKACEGKYAIGCFNLGVSYSKGVGVQQDTQKAAQFFQKACDGDYDRGCFNLGVRYDKGEGVQQNKQKAAQLYQKACDAKHTGSCYNLGLMYAKGDSIRQDKQKAAQLYQKACEGEDAMGCFTLGVSYFEGEGVQQGKQKAAQLFQKACDGGYPTGCYNLGAMYAQGEDVQQDKQKAAQLFQKACDGGDENGCKYRSNTAKPHTENSGKFSEIHNAYKYKLGEHLDNLYPLAEAVINEESKRVGSGAKPTLTYVMAKIILKVPTYKTEMDTDYVKIFAHISDTIATILRDEMNKNLELKDLIIKVAHGTAGKEIDGETRTFAKVLGEVYKVYFENYRPNHDVWGKGKF